MKRITFAAVLLAGGESRRMGRDKATMDFGGLPLWKRQLQVFHGLKAENILISARTAPDWLPTDAQLLLDDAPSRGPLSGLTKALAAIETTHLVVLAVDLPMMTAEELGRSLELATEGCGAVPIIGGRAEPLAAVYPVEAMADFRAALAGSDFSLQSIVGKLAAAGKVRLRPLPETAAHLYQNWNEPDDFKEGRFQNRPS
jgi:molybdopterin-guanine dinucleotide biosynthesis protein A